MLRYIAGLGAAAIGWLETEVLVVLPDLSAGTAMVAALGPGV